MFRQFAFSAFFALCASTTLHAQSYNTDTQWTTHDGTVRLSGTTLTLRDYRFTLIATPQPQVFRFEDPRTHATAELDLREAAGMYLTIADRGETMQVVSPTSSARSIDGMARSTVTRDDK